MTTNDCTANSTADLDEIEDLYSGFLVEPEDEDDRRPEPKPLPGARRAGAVR